MKKVVFIILLLSATLGFSQSDTAICSDDYKGIINKGDTLINPCGKLVVLSPQVFAKYYHDSKKLGILGNQIPEWAASIDSIFEAHKKNRTQLDSIIKLREEQVLLERESKEAALVIADSLEKENRKLSKGIRRWRGLSAGSSGLSVILLLILL